MSKLLSEQVAVITGASSGTGRCTAQYLADRGTRLVVTVRRLDALDELVQEITAEGEPAIAGFTEALWAERWGSGIALSVLYPSTVDTPVYQHACGKLGVLPKPIPPVAGLVEAARAIARLAERLARDGYFFWARPIALLNTAFPVFSDWLLHHVRRANWTEELPSEDKLGGRSTRGAWELGRVWLVGADATGDRPGAPLGLDAGRRRTHKKQ